MVFTCRSCIQQPLYLTARVSMQPVYRRSLHTFLPNRKWYVGVHIINCYGSESFFLHVGKCVVGGVKELIVRSSSK